MPGKGRRPRIGAGAVVAIVAAAGEGRRAGSRVPKQFLKAGGRTLLEHAVRRLASHPEVDAIVVAAPASRLRTVRALLAGGGKVADVVAGGPRRQDSVRRALDAPAAMAASILLVHDAARPLVPPAVITEVIREARRGGAAVPGVPPADTVKQVGRGGRVVRTLPRESLRMIQTPQAFRGAILREAYARAEGRGEEATDDAALVEAAGRRVRVVPGAAGNFKVTTPEDLARARALLNRQERGR